MHYFLLGASIVLLFAMIISFLVDFGEITFVLIFLGMTVPYIEDPSQE